MDSRFETHPMMYETHSELVKIVRIYYKDNDGLMFGLHGL
jgi:hypothetical protein